ncbi:HK97-gp10 family putative phage morphogenesis protein [Palleronia caenipelagi]|uniref:HK97 gp10 family phage protein n=1 Tax=Palleronia caenipelagi TaxID=2489174 RepID=A0A547Q699_9RHOB|nr:HK97-gp10 family putative phage morphogenesis protein [Palleronia caenipelagi]TRD21909.1 HK97 gp10 family phage protein [Palleronia caenipelagi]
MPSTATLHPRIRTQLERTPDIAVAAAADAMERGAEEIVAMMKTLAPHDDGDLRDSIGWTWGDEPKGSLKIGTIRSGRNAGRQFATLKITFFVGAFYAHMVEFGTSPHAQPKMRRIHPGTSAQPFFYAAWRAKKAGFRRKIRTAVRKAIREALRG